MKPIIIAAALLLTFCSFAFGGVIAVDVEQIIVVPTTLDKAERYCYRNEGIYNWTLELGDRDGDNIYTKEDAYSFCELGYGDNDGDGICEEWSHKTECYCVTIIDTRIYKKVRRVRDLEPSTYIDPTCYVVVDYFQ